MTKKGYHYQGFSLDTNLISHIKEHIKDKQWRYRTVSDFVRQAALKLLDEESK